MSAVVSALTYFVPGLLRPSIARPLYAAYNDTFEPRKFSAYVKIAESLSKQGCPYSAKGVLFVAERLLCREKSYSKIKSLCEIAKVKILLSPGVLPQEVNEAASLEQINRTDALCSGQSYYLGAVHAKALCYIAERHLQAKHYETAKPLIAEAFVWARKEPRALEATEVLTQVAELQKEVDIESAEQTLKEALKRIPEIMTSYVKATKSVQIAKVYFSIDPQKAEEVLAQVRCAIDDSYHCLVDAASNELNKLKETR